MGTTIDATAVTCGSRWGGRRGRKLADAAAIDCLARAGLEPDDVDLLLHTGLYHERNLGEPAVAALLQQDIGANPHDPHIGRHGTFSFDIANGTCGVLTAFQIADRFLRAGTIRHALVIAGDANPSHHAAPGFPFGATGAAAVLSRDESTSGLVDFQWHTAPEDADLFRAIVSFESGHNLLRIHEAPEFADRAAVWAAKVGASLLADHGLTPDDIDLVVAAPVTAVFLDAVAINLGVPADRVVVPVLASRPHTAALLFALADAQVSGRLTAARRVLLLAAGAGITAGAALLIP